MHRTIVATGCLLFVAGTAHATVKQLATLDDLLAPARAAAVVTPFEQHAAWEGGRIVTRTRVRVERVLAGDVGGAPEVTLLTRGGTVGGLAQRVEGEARFVPGASSLVFLRPHPGEPVFDVARAGQGQYVLRERDGVQRLAAPQDVGLLVVPILPVPRAVPRGAREILSGRTVEEAREVIARQWEQAHAH